jgi:hypothetical protein
MAVECRVIMVVASHMRGTWLVLFSSAVQVSQRRNCVSINENDRLNWSREMICFYSENHMKRTNVRRMGNVQICSAECGSTYSYHSTLSYWNISKLLLSIACPFVIPSYSVIRLNTAWDVVLLNKPKIHHVAWLHLWPPPYSLSCLFQVVQQESVSTVFRIQMFGILLLSKICSVYHIRREKMGVNEKSFVGSLVLPL